MNPTLFSHTDPWPLAPNPLLSGQRLDREEANRLWDLDLLALGAAADRMRRRLNPAPRVTYVIDRNINYSNICVSGCRFCAFFRPPGHPDGYLLSRDEILRKVAEAVAVGATQILMQGGLHPELPIAWFEETFRAMKARFPGITIHSLSAPEIVHLSQHSRLSY